MQALPQAQLFRLLLPGLSMATVPARNIFLHGMGSSLGSRVSLGTSCGHSCCTPQPGRAFPQTRGECSCSWKRLLHLDLAPRESWDKRRGWGHWGHMYLGPAAAPALFHRQKGGADMWLSENQQQQREGEALGSTEEGNSPKVWL